MIAWWWTILAASLGCTLGVFLMGWLNASGPSADEAIHLLRGMYALAVTHTAIPAQALETVSRFLLRYGDGEQGA